MFSGQIEFERSQPKNLCQQFEHRTGNFQLKLPEPDDADKLFSLIEANRTRLRQWLPWLDDNQNLEDSRQFIQRMQTRAIENQGFAALICSDGEIAGIIDLHEVSWNNRTAAIGYWITQTHEGRGLVTQACRALISYAYSRLNLNRITILCARHNARSQAIPKRLGFTHEGTLRQYLYLYGQYLDHDLYALLKQDWLRQDWSKQDWSKQD